MNTIGDLFRLTTFGESPGPAICGVLDGCPSGIKIDFDFIDKELQRRTTAQAESASQRVEPDRVEWLSGLLDGMTLGTPIAFIVRNEDARSEDYETMKEVFRPSHADFTYQQKYGIRDWRGGGRASARTTVPVVVAGAIAKQILLQQNIQIKARVLEIGGESDPERIEELLLRCRKGDDSVGGIASCSITGLPAGLGEPMFDKFQACLAKAMFSIPAVKGFEYGDGFKMTRMLGSQANDAFGTTPDGCIRPMTNHSGGIQGGVTNGEEVFFNVAFKPIPTIGHGNRHDVCALPRALVIVEAMAALTVMSFRS